MRMSACTATLAMAMMASAGEQEGGAMADKVVKSDKEWQSQLTDEQYRVTRKKGTERPFTGKYWNTRELGIYSCICCGTDLFLSDTKFDAGCGWPSYFKPVNDEVITEHRDVSLGMVRTEVVCSKCGAHLGHVFPDGPPPTGLRYCINSASLDFRKPDETETQKHPLSTGHPVPDLKLTTADGQVLDLKATAAKQPVVLIFYRGGWCPYCNIHLGELQKIDSQLRDLGYRILAISPDRPEELSKTAEKDGLSYTLLADSSMLAAKAFGLAFTVDEATLEKYKDYGIDLEKASGQAHHMLPVPAVFIVGTDGVIRFAHVNPDYKTRIDPAELLAAARIVAAP